MRLAWIIMPTMIAQFSIQAADMTNTQETPALPPAYVPLRFNENYSYLSNALNRGDWLDAAKYIPLRSDDPSWYLTFGGELRERFEGNYNLNFGIGGTGADSYLLQR